MAAADTAPSFRPLAAARSTLAWLARSRLAALAADAVICSFISGMWILFGAALAMDIGSLACGESCPVVGVAAKVMAAAGCTVALVSPVTLRLLLVPEAGSVADVDEEKAVPARKSFAAAARETLRDPVMIGILVSWPFILLILVGCLLKDHSPAKESRMERIGSLIIDLGALGTHAVYFLIHPVSALRLWRIWRVIRLRR